ncbi:CarD family transcriptional regulator, partial [Bifidobacteriaceae bacterium NR021]
MTLWETVMSFSVHTEGSVEYQVGDMVVYPRHGAARVEEISERTVKGVTRQY